MDVNETGGTVDPEAWRRDLSRLVRDGAERALLVQCDLEWLRPARLALRNEIEDAIFEALDRHPGLRVDRLILHNLPTLRGAREGDLNRLNAAHQAWTQRLVVTYALLNRRSHYFIQRRLITGDDQETGREDQFDTLRRRAWRRPERVRPILALMAGKGVTPMTGDGLELELDGPYGDADPTVLA
jgi:hypothetical protein